MVKSKVAVIKCRSYDESQVSQAVKRGIDLLGGLAVFVKAGEKIVLKPNVLIGSDPSRCVTTHPQVLISVGHLFQAAGARVSYGDSSALGGGELNLRLAGLKQAGDQAGFTVADFDHGHEVSHPGALLAKKITLANGILEADGVVSLPKLKTHGLTRFTGAVKNQFGCVPGLRKREFHFKMPDPYQFATMLVDVNTFIRPRLFVMDGVLAMEGNGPFGGKQRRMNVLLFSTDPVALDAIACKMIDLNPEFVPTSKPGEKSGLGVYHYTEIELQGDSLGEFIAKDFKVTRRPPVPATVSKIGGFIRNQLTPRPVTDRTKYSGCNTCVEACPVNQKALVMDQQGTRKYPKYAPVFRTCPQNCMI